MSLLKGRSRDGISPQTSSQENKQFDGRHRQNSKIASQVATVREVDKMVMPMEEGGGGDTPIGKSGCMGGKGDEGGHQNGLRDLYLATHNQNLPHTEVRVATRPKERVALSVRGRGSGVATRVW